MALPPNPPDSRNLIPSGEQNSRLYPFSVESLREVHFGRSRANDDRCRAISKATGTAPPCGHSAKPSALPDLGAIELLTFGRRRAAYGTPDKGLSPMFSFFSTAGSSATVRSALFLAFLAADINSATGCAMRQSRVLLHSSNPKSDAKCLPSSNTSVCPFRQSGRIGIDTWGASSWPLWNGILKHARIELVRTSISIQDGPETTLTLIH